MMIFDDIFAWKGWGGSLRLGSGTCRLRIFNLQQGAAGDPTPLRPIIVIVTDVAESPMSVRSCAGHIATSIVREFDMDPQRMLYVEYAPCKIYGEQHQYQIPERFDVVDFTWHDKRAIKPIWRSAQPPLRNVLRPLLQGS